MNHWISESTDQWMSKWLKQWIIESMNQTTSESMNFAQALPRKVLRMPQFLNNFKCKPSSCYSLVWCTFCQPDLPKVLQTPDYQVIEMQSRTFCQLHLLKVLRSPPLFAVLMCKPSSRHSLVHILPTSSSKSAHNASVCVTIKNANPALATVLCTFCQVWNGGNPGLRARECLHPWVHMLPSDFKMCGWHDDVVDMIVWMTNVTCPHLKCFSISQVTWMGPLCVPSYGFCSAYDMSRYNYDCRREANNNMYYSLYVMCMFMQLYIYALLTHNCLHN
jgi:hypothetical protein